MNFEILEQAFSKYPEYRESGLNSVWITHADIIPKIEALSKNENVSLLREGVSIEGREIFRIKAGHGKTRILLWSQMHGNESTATRAIFDLINFLTVKDDLARFKNTLLESLEIHFVPMLNPDGAERFIRENAINIDLNRDALSFQSPESRILQTIKDEINPEFCFNLHDQNRYYSVGRTGNSPVLSFLAPPSGYNAPANKARERAMQVIAHLKNILDKYIPGRVAKYSDDHEPRSFGDNFNRQDSSVILVESGYLNNDTDKEKIREYNFIALLSAFETISTGSYKKNSINDYLEITENNEAKFFDLLLKDAIIQHGKNEFKVDIGINRRDFPAGTGKILYTKGMIEGLGDLSTFSAYETIPCGGLTVYEGKIYDEALITYNEINKLNLEQLLAGGFTTVLCKDFSLTDDYCSLPVNIIKRDNIKSHEIKTDSPANLYLGDKSGIRYIIVNGFLIDLSLNKNSIRNGLIFH